MSSLEFQTVERRTGSKAASRDHIFGLKKGDMAGIDYATCDVSDVIAYSLKLHPQLLRDRLRSHACVHAEFADAYENRDVTRSELGLADRLHSFANAVRRGDYTIPDDLDVRREAFSCAASLQDLHPIMQQAIAEREDAGKAGPDRSGRDRGNPNDASRGH